MSAFHTLVKTASEFIRRSEQQRHAELNKSVQVTVEGRHLLIPTAALRLATGHRFVPGSPVVGCCGRAVESLGERDRLGADPAIVNCAGAERPLEGP